MALSLEQKHQILFHLGYPAKTLIPDTNLYNSIVNDRLENLDSFSQDRVESLLSEMESSRTNLRSLENQGKLKQVGDIVFNTENNDRNSQGEYRRVRKELARTLDIPMVGGGSSFKVCV